MVAYQPTTKQEPKIRRTFAPQSDDKVWLRGFSVYGKPVPFPGTEFSGWSQPQRDNILNNERDKTILFRASSIWKDESADTGRQDLLLR